MRIFLISDSHDALHGLRLAGIEGAYAAERKDALDALDKCLADPGIAIVLITDKLKALCVKEVYAAMLERSAPLIVEIPGPGDGEWDRGGIVNYIRDAIGLKM